MGLAVPPCRLWRYSSSGQHWQQAPLPAEPPHWSPTSALVMCILLVSFCSATVRRSTYSPVHLCSSLTLSTVRLVLTKHILLPCKYLTLWSHHSTLPKAVLKNDFPHSTRETMPGTGNLASYPGLVKSWRRTYHCHTTKYSLHICP